MPYTEVLATAPQNPLKDREVEWTLGRILEHDDTVKGFVTFLYAWRDGIYVFDYEGGYEWRYDLDKAIAERDRRRTDGWLTPDDGLYEIPVPGLTNERSIANYDKVQTYLDSEDWTNYPGSITLWRGFYEPTPPQPEGDTVTQTGYDRTMDNIRLNVESLINAWLRAATEAELESIITWPGDTAHQGAEAEADAAALESLSDTLHRCGCELAEKVLTLLR